MAIIIISVPVAIISALVGYFAFNLGVWGVVLCLVLGYLVTHIICGLVGIISCMGYSTEKPVDKISSFHYFLARTYADFVSSYAGLRVSVENRELIPTEGRFLYVSNHLSALDPMAVLTALPKYKISFVAKPSLLKVPLLKTVGPAAGFLAIDRENDRNALKTILTAANYAKNDLCSIGIYPEGTRSKNDDGTMLPFHAGSLKIAQKANIPIVVVSTVGTEKIKKNFPFRPTRVKLRVLEVIPAEKVKATPTAELAAYTHDLIQADVYAQMKGQAPAEYSSAVSSM